MGQVSFRSDKFPTIYSYWLKIDPSYIYFKEIKIDQDNTFTANFSEENEIENIKFNKENEYGITGLTINVDLPDKKILKIENEKEQKRISEEIQNFIKEVKEPNLTLYISHSETLTIKIPFIKKKMKAIYRN